MDLISFSDAASALLFVSFSVLFQYADATTSFMDTGQMCDTAGLGAKRNFFGI